MSADLMPGTDTPDPVAAQAQADRAELVRTCARSILAEQQAGRSVDPLRVEWARATLNLAPARLTGGTPA